MLGRGAHGNLTGSHIYKNKCHAPLCAKITIMKDINKMKYII